MKGDQYYLRLATKEGSKNPPGYNFGAVIVRDGTVLACERNKVRENHDPSAHAEVLAIRKAAAAAKDHNIDGAVMYGSHEPCLMCFSCAAWANVTRIVYALPASEQDGSSYEFNGVQLKDLASKLANRRIDIELIRLTD